MQRPSENAKRYLRIISGLWRFIGCRITGFFRIDQIICLQKNLIIDPVNLINCMMMPHQKTHSPGREKYGNTNGKYQELEGPAIPIFTLPGALFSAEVRSS